MIASNILASSCFLVITSLGSPEAAPEETAASEAAPAAEEAESGDSVEEQAGQVEEAEGSAGEAEDEWDPLAGGSAGDSAGGPPASPTPARQVLSDEFPPQTQPGTPPAPRGKRYIREAERPVFIHAAMGGSRPIRNPEYDNILLDSVHLEQSLGYHLDGTGYGAALAFVTQQTFADAFNAYVFGLRYQHDVALDDGLGVYLSPMFTLGYRRITDRGTDVYLANCPTDVPVPCEPEVFNQATLQFSLGVTVVIADRLPLFIRPINLDLGLPHINDSGERVLTIRWQVLGGLGVSF